MTTQARDVGSRAARAREIEVPRDVRALSMLPRVDYADAFVVELDRPMDRTAPQWAKAMVQDAPMQTRRMLRWAWFALGLKLGAASSEGTVLGWEPRRSTPEVALFGAGSRIGMPAEVLFVCRQEALLFATFVQQDNPVARAVWAVVAPRHRRVVRHLLNQTMRSERQP